MTLQTWIDPELNKSEWGEGPWMTEPDKPQWTDAATGFVCLIIRNRMGALCGYVGVEPEHSFFEQKYNSEALNALKVHGGLTFSDHCQPGPIEQTICHIPAPGESDNIWWLGFDCAHAWDFMPQMIAFEKKYFPDFTNLWKDCIYRDIAYVQAECASLAAQIAGAIRLRVRA